MTEQEKAQAVIDAWKVPGWCPAFHESMKLKLMREWPVLARALEGLVK